MSRIGNKAIPIPKGVDVNIANDTVSVKGPKGQLSRSFVPQTSVALDDGKVVVTRNGNSRSARAYHGLMRVLIANMIHGVTVGFTKELEVIGIGYKAEVTAKKLILNLGFSHQIDFDFRYRLPCLLPLVLLATLGLSELLEAVSLKRKKSTG